MTLLQTGRALRPWISTVVPQEVSTNTNYTPHYISYQSFLNSSDQTRMTAASFSSHAECLRDGSLLRYCFFKLSPSYLLSHPCTLSGKRCAGSDTDSQRRDKAQPRFSFGKDNPRDRDRVHRIHRMHCERTMSTKIMHSDHTESTNF